MSLHTVFIKKITYVWVQLKTLNYSYSIVLEDHVVRKLIGLFIEDGENKVLLLFHYLLYINNLL